MKNRESSFEAVRIICIMLIVVMHTFGTGVGQVNTAVGIFVNVIGNMGVTGFVLLSGYFGVRAKADKLIRLDLTIIIWSIVSEIVLICNPLLEYGMDKKRLLSSIIPIISHRYWFLSAYFCLCILSPYINEYLEKISKERFKQMLIAAGTLFLILPTVFGFDQTGDGGKGIVNMILAYLIGRYIGMYYKDVKIKVSKLFGLLLGLVVINFALNYGMYLVAHSTANYYARDNSILIMAQSVIMLLIAIQCKGYHAWINVLAANVVIVYVLEDTIKQMILSVFDYLQYEANVWYIGLVLLVSVGTYLSAVLLEAIRKKVFGKLDDLLVKVVADRVNVWIKQ